MMDWNDLKFLEVEIGAVYMELSDARRHYFSKQEFALLKRAKLEEEKATCYSRGAVEGKNQKEREGWIAINLRREIDLYKEAEKESREARLKLDLALDKIAYQRAMFRIFEISVMEQEI